MMSLIGLVYVSPAFYLSCSLQMWMLICSLLWLDGVIMLMLH